MDAAGAEPDRVVIDLKGAEIYFIVDFDIETAADGEREIRVRERSERADRYGAGCLKTGNIAAETIDRDAGERVREGFEARLRLVVFDLNAAEEIIDLTLGVDTKSINIAARVGE